MTQERKHYVYSARTTKEGLALLVKAKGDKGWDMFVNGAVCATYGLDPAVVSLPPGTFAQERAEKKAATDAERKVEAKAKGGDKVGGGKKGKGATTGLKAKSAEAKA